MPGYDSASLIDQHRVGKTELADAPGDLRDLRIGVRASVPGIRDQRPALRAAARSPSVTACFNAPDDAEAIKQNTRRARCRVAGMMAYPSE